MTILLGVIGLFAVLCWIIAVVQAVTIVRLSAAEHRSWTDWILGWWKFDAVRKMAGAGGSTHAMIYQRAMIAFVLFVVLGIIVGSVSASMSERAAENAAQIGPINDPRVIPAQFAFNSDLTDFRRAATMPGALTLES